MIQWTIHAKILFSDYKGSVIIIFSNYPLIAAMLAIFISQLIKVPVAFMLKKPAALNLIFSTGGMPSSHSAGVTGLVTAVVMENGWQSHLTAIAITFGVIVIFDSMGVRRQSGEHSILINELVDDFKSLRKSFVNLSHDGVKEFPILERKSREMLGHKPIEVFFGILFGITISLITYYLFYV